MEELGITRRTVVASLGATAGDPEASRLRLLGWRARRGWFGHSGMWALLPARPTGQRRGPGGPRDAAIARAPSLFRVVRLELDLAFRTPGEAALLHVAHVGGTVAQGACKAGVIFVGASLAFVMVPAFTVLLALVGFSLLAMAGVAKVLSWFAAMPARTIRAVRLQRWSTACPSSPAADGERIRLRGRVMPLQTVPALDGRPAVFQRLRATRRGRGAELLKGDDFMIDDGSGTPTRVSVAHALFLDRPARVFGSWLSPPLEVCALVPGGSNPIDLDEAALYPGDEVEVVGAAEMVVDPALGDRLERSPPLVRVLTGTADEPLLIRSVL